MTTQQPNTATPAPDAATLELRRLADLAKNGAPWTDTPEPEDLGPLAREARAMYAAGGALAFTQWVQITPQATRALSGDPAAAALGNVFRTWQPQKLDDITKPEPRRAVVEGLLYRETLSVCFGAPGALKSFILADLALCVATGRPWLYPDPGEPGAAPLLELKTQPGAVYWIDFDNGLYTSSERFYALKNAHHTQAAPLYLYSMPDPWLDLSHPQHANDFAGWLAAQPDKPALVVIDNLAYISGGIAENDPAMKNVTAALKRAAELSGAHITAIHHERKSNGRDARAGERMRGSSAIEAGLDLALLFERPDTSTPEVTIQPTKNRIIRYIPILGVRLKTEADANRVMTAARCWQIPPDSPQEERARVAIAEVVTKHGQAAKTELATLAAAKVDLGINRTRTLIEKMISEGALVATQHETGRGKPVIITLPLD